MQPFSICIRWHGSLPTLDEPQVAKVRLAVLCWPGSAIVKEPLSIEAVKALTAKWSYPGAPLWTPTLATYCIIAHAGFLLYSDAAVVLVTVVRDVKSMESDDDESTTNKWTFSCANAKPISSVLAMLCLYQGRLFLLLYSAQIWG